MPSVKDELEELRKRSITKAHANKLQGAQGLSTPEQEAEALREAKNKTSSKTYSKEAVETLKAGSKAVGQDMEMKLKQSAWKKEDMQKKREAAQNLQSFKGTVSSPTKKAADTKGGTPTPAAVTETAPDPSVEETSEDIPEVPEVDDVPELEEVGENGAAEPDAAMMPSMDGASSTTASRVQNRAEKKARKVMERIGMKPVSGISRVTLKMRGNQGFFTIYQPDVFEKNGAYIVFGEARQGTGMPQVQQQQAQAVQQLETIVADEKKIEAVETEEVVDETGLEPKDIELVVSQAGCARARAVKALKDNDGDLVNAIMSLTN